LEEFLQRLAEELAPRIKAEREKSSVWVSQKDSPLGRNRHCAAVKRRISEGLEGAALIGRKCLLTADALREEMQAHHGLVARPLAKVAAASKENVPPIVARVNARIARGG
jgi:hypothetical protein